MNASRGHPIYDPTFHPQDLIEQMTGGALNIMVFASWKVSKKTFYEWLKIHPEMASAYEEGETACEAWWLQKMKEKFELGDESGFKYCALIVNTKFGYRDSQASNVTNNTINVQGNMVVLQEKSRDELIDFIRDGLEDNNIINANFTAIEAQSGPLEENR